MSLCARCQRKSTVGGKGSGRLGLLNAAPSKILQSVPLIQFLTQGDPLVGSDVYSLSAVTAAALAFMMGSLSRNFSPETITTDGLRSCNAPMKDLGSAKRQGLGRRINSRVENQKGALALAASLIEQAAKEVGGVLANKSVVEQQLTTIDFDVPIEEKRKVVELQLRHAIAAAISTASTKDQDKQH